jgi:hypothetical protein
MDKNLSFPARAWQTLSAIDVTPHTELRGRLPFLPWPWAWATLMDTYPDSTFEMKPPGWLENGTAEVTVDITLRDGDEAMTRTMWLPVMDYNNNSIENPTTRDISDARMRVLVKCLGIFGLGVQLYAKSDLPISPDRTSINARQVKILKTLLKQTKRDEARFLQWAECETLEEVPGHAFGEAVAMLEKELAGSKKQ